MLKSQPEGCAAKISQASRWFVAERRTLEHRELEGSLEAGNPVPFPDKWLSSLLLKTSSDGAPTTSGGKQFHGSHPLLLALPSGALENRWTPSFFGAAPPPNIARLLPCYSSSLREIAD
ncbi:hypothetical protein L345_17920, partial [Ophiophagus hannah]